LLDPISELTLDHDSHRYTYKGQLLARSVSEVVGHDLTPEQRAGMERYKHGPDGWAARGTAIHKVLEHHLKGEPCVMDDKWSPWVDALLDESIFGRFRLLACEFLLVDERRSMGGSFDFLIELEELGVPEGKGLILLGDLKTVSRGRNAARSSGRILTTATRLGKKRGLATTLICLTFDEVPSLRMLVDLRPGIAPHERQSHQSPPQMQSVRPRLGNSRSQRSRR
jgi:hypothetical protein